MKNVTKTGKFPRVRSREEQLVSYKLLSNAVDTNTFSIVFMLGLQIIAPKFSNIPNSNDLFRYGNVNIIYLTYQPLVHDQWTTQKTLICLWYKYLVNDSLEG